MKAPTVHLNGTGHAQLMEAVLDARAAVHEAVKKLSAVMPNGRDYYVQGDGALAEARKDYDQMYSNLVAVEVELTELADAIDDQKRR